MHHSHCARTSDAGAIERISQRHRPVLGGLLSWLGESHHGKGAELHVIWDQRRKENCASVISYLRDFLQPGLPQQFEDPPQHPVLRSSHLSSTSELQSRRDALPTMANVHLENVSLSLRHLPPDQDPGTGVGPSRYRKWKSPEQRYPFGSRIRRDLAEASPPLRHLRLHRRGERCHRVLEACLGSR